MANAEVTWVATLSDGSTVAEHTGEYQHIPGERTPWVRLTQFAAKNKLYITSLRLNFRGRTIHMPRPNFGRFGLNKVSRAPLFYSLNYMVEGEMSGDELIHQTTFVSLVAHYSDFDVHYIQDTEEGNNSWVLVTEGYNPAAPSPINRGT